MSLYDIPHRVLVRAQFISRTRDSPKEILTLLVAVRIVGTLFQRIEHVGARGALVHQGAIAVILEEVAAIKYRQGDRRVKVRRRGHIAEYITVRVLLPVTVGLLEAELDEETEELPRVECTGDVRRVRVIRLQGEQAEQPHADYAHQPSTSCHFSARTAVRPPPLFPIRESRQEPSTTDTLSIFLQMTAHQHSCYRDADDGTRSSDESRAPSSSRGANDEFPTALLSPLRHSRPPAVVLLGSAGETSLVAARRAER